MNNSDLIERPVILLIDLIEPFERPVTLLNDPIGPFRPFERQKRAANLSRD